MDGTDRPPESIHGSPWRIPALNLLWLLSPLGYPLLYVSRFALPAPIAAGISMAYFLILPGWLLHLLLYPRARIGLAARITRAFALSVAITSVLGLFAWFFGGDFRLGPVNALEDPPVPLAGRLSSLIWAQAILLMIGATALLGRVIRSQRRLAASQRAPVLEPASPNDALSPESGSHPPAGEAEAQRAAETSPRYEMPLMPGMDPGNPVMQRIFREAYRLGDQHKVDHPIAPRWATLLVLGVMMLTAAILGLYAGGIFGSVTDSLDHISCLREMLSEDRILPRATFYVDGDGAAVDARKGFFHVSLAAQAMLIGVDPVKLWDLLPALLIPLALVVFHTFARRLLRSEGTALLATFLALICFGEVSTGGFVRLAYGSQMGTVLAWAALAIALEYIMGVRRRGRRMLWLIALSVFAAAATHAFAALHVLFALGVFALVLLIFRRPSYPAVARAWIALGAAIAGALPMMLWRLIYTSAALNPIHTHQHGILWFTDRLYILLPSQWADFLSVAGFGAILLSFLLWRRARDDDAVLYMASLSIAPLLIVANPLLVPLLEPKLGYLIARFVLAIPFLMVLAYMARWMGESLLELKSRGQVIVSLLFYVFMVLLLFPRLEGFARSYSFTARAQRQDHSALVWLPLLEMLQTELAHPAVVLSDPMTSYSIPAFTRHFTVSVLHQHASPSDSLALTRLAVCRDVLSPYIGTGRKARLCRKFKVDYVLLNGMHPRNERSFFCDAGPAVYADQRRALEEDDALFDEVWDGESQGTLYRVRKENLDALAGIVTPGAPALVGRTAEQLTGEILARVLPNDTYPVVADTIAGITLMAVGLDTTLVARGERVGVTLYWRRVAEPSRFPVDVHIRIDTPAPRGRFWTMSLSKIHRHLIERRIHQAYRAQLIRSPLRGLYGIEHWPLDRFVVDHFELYAASYLAKGEYELKVKWMEQTFLPNLPILHFTSDRDISDGETVGLLDVY